MTDVAPQRRFSHVDLDAFFASVEAHDRPQLAGRPLVVGGNGPRSVVAAASYEARRFGIHSAMPMTQAKEKCKTLVIVPPRMARYQEVSEEFFQIIGHYSDSIEALSIDECFLDIAHFLGQELSAMAKMKRDIKHHLGLNASIGIAHVKFAAKILSDASKPNGLLYMDEENFLPYLHQQPIKVLWGVGKKRELLLRNLGIHHVHELASASPALLQNALGEKTASLLQALSMGIDPRPIMSHRPTKSMSAEHTYTFDVNSLDALLPVLKQQAESLETQIREAGLVADTLGIKYRLPDFTTFTRQLAVRDLDDKSRILDGALLLLRKHLPESPIRLIGISLSSFRPKTSTLWSSKRKAGPSFETTPSPKPRLFRFRKKAQLSLFDEEGEHWNPSRLD